MSASDGKPESPAGGAPFEEDPQIAELRAEMERFKAQRDECAARSRELMAAEDPDAGIFHAAEIFRLGQEKLRLDVEMEFRRKKINRIRLGITEQTVGASAGRPQ